MNRNEIPMGFGMALAQNPEAMNKFAELSEKQKKEIMESTHAINSKDDMRRLINKIAADY